ncbi:glycoside hydrolase family 2 TIM barrel-domain containing protein [Propioniciclava soli]|uniref:beta-galactosidase n=1 Tax=Propioniciclava soli TaxID=2775081 RepID=A0ABZ3C6A1_9ACTN|nr:glycoside hydrolase family 2 TIM barrel-domain containing protein [Propioniciclava soli]
MKHIEEISPGSGMRVAPRSELSSTAERIDLGGAWRFRHSATPAQAAALASNPGVYDAGWDTIDVPSHWVLRGEGSYGRPAYNNVLYPFPLDPPHVPDANPTGDHWRTFDLPAAWLDDGRVVLRFDGIESIGVVTLNDVEVGVVRGSRLRQELDVTDAVRPGENTLHVRVHQWSAMTYVEDQDQWWLPGIFREVTLLHRPAGGIDDVWLRADVDPATGRGTLTPELRATGPVRITCPELGLDATVDADAPGTIAVGEVEPWSADVPRLYTVTVANEVESIELRVGFRRVQIDGDAWLVNGRRVRLRGVNRHDFDPVNGRVVDPAELRRQLELMKRYNVNAIRTSHYPPHPTLLALADELGFWVIDECDIETHGFVAAGWQGNPSDDPAWRDVYLDRAERMLERDKNHACIIAWSLGNEAGVGGNLAAMAAWLRRRDPSRPIHYEGDHDDLVPDVVSRMYAPLEELRRLTVARAGRPIMLCEYVHAMGNGAGGVAEYEEVFDAHPAIHGGFVWEWRDHGLLTHTADGTPFHGYGGDFGEEFHDGSFVCDGLLLADGTPSPALAEFAAVVTPIKVNVGTGAVTVENRRHDGDTADLTFAWDHEVDGHVVASGTLNVPPVLAGAEASAALPDLSLDAPGEHWLTVRAELAAAAPWADAGHVVTSAQRQLREATAPAPGATSAEPGVATASGYTLGEATFDESGRLTSLGGLALTGGQLTLWRAPTENDLLSGFGSYELGAPEETGGLGAPGPSSAARWREAGLDRLQHRVLAADADADGLLVRTLVAPAGIAQHVVVEQRWAWTDGALTCAVDVTPSTGWDRTWPRIGLAFELPLGHGRAAWFGTGPHENYPDSDAAARVGRFEADVAELTVPYAVPQESGHRAGLRELTLTGEGVPPLTVTTTPVAGHRVGFTVGLHSAAELAAAAHPHELPPPQATHLVLDLAQHGLGSRSCGPDVRPRFALWPRPASASFALRVG